MMNSGKRYVFSLCSIAGAAIFLLAVLGWGGSVLAQGPAEDAEVRSEVTSIAPGRPFWIAVKIDAGPGGSIPWADPEMNMPGTSLYLNEQEGFERGELIRPVPRPLTGQNRYGYEGPIWLLQEILVSKNLPFQETYGLGGEVNWIVCQANDCSEETVPLSLALPFGRGLPDTAVASLFSDLRRNAPGLLPWPAEYAAGAGNFRLSLFIEDAMAENIAGLFILPEGVQGIPFNGELALERRENGVSLKGELPEDSMPAKTLKGLLFVEREDASGRVYQIEVKNSFKNGAGFDAASGDLSGLTLWAALGLAFIGGLILNLMPCVFPVLTLKVFGLVKAGGHSPRRMKLDGFAYTGGILLSFVIVALLLLTFRSFGEQVGWGFQLQSPAFVTVLALLLFAVTLNFAGFYEIRVPFAFDPGKKGEGALGSFYTGILATVVATPCTAPFMAPALGFALTLSPPEAVLVFLALGLGLAFPYLLVSFFPRTQRIFPKPGPWMNTFRKILAIPLLATVGWLAWVLYTQVGENGVWLLIGYAVLLAGFLQWLKDRRKWSRAVKIATLAIYTAASVAFVTLTWPVMEQSKTPAPGVDGEAAAFSPDAVWNLRLQGRGVFVNFTASWCITCLVNERVVFSKPAFQKFLKENDIVYMEADWTNPDPGIARTIEQFGRSGLPVYAFYPPGGPTQEVVLLPEVLTLDGAIKRIRANLP